MICLRRIQNPRTQTKWTKTSSEDGPRSGQALPMSLWAVRRWLCTGPRVPRNGVGWWPARAVGRNSAAPVSAVSGDRSRPTSTMCCRTGSAVLMSSFPIRWMGPRGRLFGPSWCPAANIWMVGDRRSRWPWLPPRVLTAKVGPAAALLLDTDLKRGLSIASRPIVARIPRCAVVIDARVVGGAHAGGTVRISSMGRTHTDESCISRSGFFYTDGSPSLGVCGDG